VARVKLSEQHEYEFHYTVMVRYRDINFGGHLGNDALIALLNDAGLHMFRALGFLEGQLTEGKTYVAMADLTVNYRAEAFMFDELEIDTHVGEPEEKGFTVFHRVRKGTDIVALAEVGLVAFDYTRHEVVPVPEVFLRNLQEYKRASVLHEGGQDETERHRYRR